MVSREQRGALLHTPLELRARDPNEKSSSDVRITAELLRMQNGVQGACSLLSSARGDTPRPDYQINRDVPLVSGA
jgi:hypothetical protein